MLFIIMMVFMSDDFKMLKHSRSLTFFPKMLRLADVKPFLRLTLWKIIQRLYASLLHLNVFHSYTTLNIIRIWTFEIVKVICWIMLLKTFFTCEIFNNIFLLELTFLSLTFSHFFGSNFRIKYFSWN